MLKKNKPHLEKISYDDFFYYILNARTKKSKVLSKSIYKLVESDEIPFLLSKGLSCDCVLKKHDTTNFEKKLLINTFIRCINKLPVRGVSIGFIDMSGLLKDEAISLLPVCNSLKILTLYPQEYDRVCNLALKKYGCQPSVSSNSEILKDTIAILSPVDKAKTDIPNNKFLFGEGGFNIRVEDFKISNKILDFVPKDIDHFEFAAALYDLCGFKRLDDVSCDNIYLNNKRYSVDNIFNEYF